jgi:hypothetical protein
MSSARTKTASNKSNHQSEYSRSPYATKNEIKKSSKGKTPDQEEDDDDDMGNTKLMAAIQDEDADLAIEMLDTEPAETLFLDAINYNNMTALQLACKLGLVDVALRLVDAGVNVNYLGGRGFRAIDYAMKTRETAKKIIEDAGPQMKFAAEDQQWPLVCEWHNDKLKSQGIVAEIDGLIDVLKNQAPDASATIGETELREQFNKQLMRYVRNGRSSRVKWNPTNGNVLASLIFLHIMRTYKESQCYVTYDTEFGIYALLDFIKDTVYLHYEYSANDNEKQNQKQNKDVLKKLADQVAQCVKLGKKQIIVPVVFGETDDESRHANMLIFRATDWAVEHYEPHGQTNLMQNYAESEGIAKNAKMHSLLGGIYEQFVEELNKRLKKTAEHKKRGPVKLHMSSDVCPSHRGFQAAQNHDEEFEGIGLCAMWALFIAEMSAAYPSLTLRQVQGAIYHKMGEYDMDMAGDFLLNLMKGYATQVLESTRLYCSFFDVEPAEWSFSALNAREDAADAMSWLVWFESKTALEPDFVQHRIRAHKQGDPNTSEDEVHYGEKYLRLKHRLDCLEDDVSYAETRVKETLPLHNIPSPNPVAAEKEKKTKQKKSKKRPVSKGGRKTRRMAK